MSTIVEHITTGRLARIPGRLPAVEDDDGISIRQENLTLLPPYWREYVPPDPPTPPTDEELAEREMTDEKKVDSVSVIKQCFADAIAEGAQLTVGTYDWDELQAEVDRLGTLRLKAILSRGLRSWMVLLFRMRGEIDTAERLLPLMVDIAP